MQPRIEQLQTPITTENPAVPPPETAVVDFIPQPPAETDRRVDRATALAAVSIQEQVRPLGVQYMEEVPPATEGVASRLPHALTTKCIGPTGWNETGWVNDDV